MVVNEDTAYGADGNGDMGGERSGKRHKGEPAKPRAKQAEEGSGKKKGAKREETAKEDRVEESIKEKMFVTTDEQGRLKMLPVQARATQHSKEPGASANANLRLFEIQPPLPQAEVPSPPPRPHLQSRWSPVGSFRRPIPISILLSHLSDTVRARHPTRNTGRSPNSPARTSSHGLFTPRLFTCPTRCSIHHRHWADRRTASTLRHFLQPL